MRLLTLLIALQTANTPQNKGTIASLLRHHYEKILFPFDLFTNGATYDENSLDDLKDKLNELNKESNGDESSAIDNQQEDEIKVEFQDGETKSEVRPADEAEKMDVDESRSDSKPVARRTSSRKLQGQSLCNVKIQNKELARLQVYSPGPKMSGFSSADSDSSPEGKNNKTPASLPVSISSSYISDCN